MKPLASTSLGPEWQVSRYDESGIVLEKTASELRRATARFLIAAGALAAAAALVSLTPDSLTLVFWPVAGLLVIVALLAIPAGVLNVMQRINGVRLTFLKTEVRGLVVPTGLFFDVRAREVASPIGEISALQLRRVSHPPLVLSLFEVALADGRTLQGPEVSFPQGETDPLEAIAQASAELTGRPLRVINP